MVGKNKPGPKPRKREPGVKLMTLPLECSNEEMQELLELLDAKVGTNNNRKRYEWLRDMVLKGNSGNNDKSA